MSFRTIVMIPKPNSDEHRGIGLIETSWKIFGNVLKESISNEIRFHKVLHGFRNQRSTTTAIIGLKFTIPYAHLYKFPTYSVFLDIEKAYDRVNRRSLLHLLKHYGIVNDTLDILKEYWNKHKCVIKNGRYYSNKFKPTEGVNQGDILSTTVFNIIVDSILKKIDSEMKYNPYLKIQID